MYGLGNAMIFLSFIFYFIGLLQFDMFMIKVPTGVDRTVMYSQYFAVLAILIQVGCYFKAKHWSNEIEKINRIKFLMDGDVNESQLIDSKGSECFKKESMIESDD